MRSALVHVLFAVLHSASNHGESLRLLNLDPPCLISVTDSQKGSAIFSCVSENWISKSFIASSVVWFLLFTMFSNL